MGASNTITSTPTLASCCQYSTVHPIDIIIYFVIFINFGINFWTLSDTCLPISQKHNRWCSAGHLNDTNEESKTASRSVMRMLENNLKIWSEMTKETKQGPKIAAHHQTSYDSDGSNEVLCQLKSNTLMKCGQRFLSLDKTVRNEWVLSIFLNNVGKRQTFHCPAKAYVKKMIDVLKWFLSKGITVTITTRHNLKLNWICEKKFKKINF